LKVLKLSQDKAADVARFKTEMLQKVEKHSRMTELMAEKHMLLKDVLSKKVEAFKQ
jgi:hypothetical protein